MTSTNINLNNDDDDDPWSNRRVELKTESECSN